MDIFEQHYRWHPRFKVIEHSDSECVLLSEKEQYILPIKNLSLLNQLLSGSVSTEEIIDKIEPDQILTLSHNINALRRAGYIVKAESLVFSQYIQPDFTLPKLHFCHRNNRVDITNLSGFTNLDRVLDCIEPINTIGRYHVVIIDDYLDPRLSELNTRFHKTNVPWLILKLTGESPTVGPLFIPNKASSPCWECIKDRIEKNQSIRAWQTRIQGQLFSIPLKLDKTNIASSSLKISNLVNQLIEAQCTDTIYELDFDVGRPKTHPAIKRPQCRFCGDSEYFAKQAFQAIELSRSKICFSKDGGVRTKTPQETNAALAHLVSPLSGLSSHLSTVSQSGTGINKIYRSTFYKTPYTNQELNAAKFVHTTMGKGITEAQSKASALCETIERLASNYQGDEPAIFGRVGEERVRYISPKALTPYSAAQYLEFSDFKPNLQSQLYGVDKYSSQLPIYWTPVWSLHTNELCYAPFNYCYDSTPFEDNYSRFFTNGGAAGNTLEEAILQGFLEIIERDAVAIWWYNKIERPAVKLDNVSEELIFQLERTLAKDWDYWALDLTHDFQVPVFAAISQHKQTGEFSFGFGCHLNARIACQRALTELCQITEIRDQNTSPFEFDKITRSAFLYPASDTTETSLHSKATKESDDIKADIEYCLARAEALDLEVFALNYSRPDFLLKTTKVIIPGCCHIFPYLAAARLYETPVKLGWLDKARRENELNNQALLI